LGPDPGERFGIRVALAGIERCRMRQSAVLRVMMVLAGLLIAFTATCCGGGGGDGKEERWRIVIHNESSLLLIRSTFRGEDPCSFLCFGNVERTAYFAFGVRPGESGVFSVPAGDWRTITLSVAASTGASASKTYGTPEWTGDHVTFRNEDFSGMGKHTPPGAGPARIRNDLPIRWLSGQLESTSYAAAPTSLPRIQPSETAAVENLPPGEYLLRLLGEDAVTGEIVVHEARHAVHDGAVISLGSPGLDTQPAYLRNASDCSWTAGVMASADGVDEILIPALRPGESALVHMGTGSHRLVAATMSCSGLHIDRVIDLSADAAATPSGLLTITATGEWLVATRKQ
jgi:hypothetical protein